MTKQLERSTAILPAIEMQAMGSNILDERQKELAGFKLIPNVRKFKVVISDYDKLFQKHDIHKRLKPKFTYEKHTNHRSNRFMMHQLIRLKRKANQPDVYWRIAMHLVKRSNTFLVGAINHVFPKWHREMKLSSVIRLAISTRRIANFKDSHLNINRIYIKKTNGKVRPLGVPTSPWRIYLHLLNSFLSHFLENNAKGFHDEQHGFRPGRGTMTAWKTILTNVIHSRDIFEFDLKGFFDSINLKYISDRLKQKGVPKDIIDMFYFINSTGVNVKPPYLLNEFEHKLKDLHKQNASYEDIVSAPNNQLSYMYSQLRGVPQGAPTSPILASLALEHSILDRPGMKAVMYADDGLYYGNLDMPIITPNSGMTSSNIYFNLNKSGWVKKDGIWLKPLKFLGLEYNGATNELSARTRKGSSLPFTKWGLVYDHLLREGSDSDSIREYKDGRTWEAMIQSKLFGFIQNRLYSGAWNMDEFIQEFEYSFKRGSWSSKINTGKYITVFNSTSFASQWLINKLKTLKSMKRL